MAANTVPRVSAAISFPTAIAQFTSIIFSASSDSAPSTIFLSSPVTLTSVYDDEPVENSPAAPDESTAIELDEWKISKVLNLKKIKESKKKQTYRYRFRHAHSGLKKIEVKEQLVVRKEQILRQRHGS